MVPRGGAISGETAEATPPLEPPPRGRLSRGASMGAALLGAALNDGAAGRGAAGRGAAGRGAAWAAAGASPAGGRPPAREAGGRPTAARPLKARAIAGAPGGELEAAVSPGDFRLLATGGLLYLAGAVVYALRWPNPRPIVFGYHEIFHMFVFAAAAVHYAAIWTIVTR